MIASHNTFTYLKPRCFAMNAFTKWWRCQKLSIDAQYKFGIRMFDIRVVRHSDSWIPAHGLAHLKGISWSSVSNIALYMKKNFPDAIYRIWLESGNDGIKDIFNTETFFLSMKIKNKDADYKGSLLWRVGIKEWKEWKNGLFNQNSELYDIGYKFATNNTWENPCYELHGYINSAKDALKTNIKEEARKINTRLGFFSDKEKLNAMINSKDELYFLDYCTNEY